MVHHRNYLNIKLIQCCYYLNYFLSNLQVSQLMAYINDVYFDGCLDLNDPAAVKHIMLGSGPSASYTTSGHLKPVISSD